MPRVSAERLERTRNAILDAAAGLCRKKPVARITMRDVVLETGMSQGGVYRYFGGIDELLIALLRREASGERLHTDLQSSGAESVPPGEAICRAVESTVQMVRETAAGSGRILLELAGLYAAKTDRYRKIQDELPAVSPLDLVKAQLAAFVETRIRSDGLTPILPVDEILVTISLALDGIACRAVLASGGTTTSDEATALGNAVAMLSGATMKRPPGERTARP